MFSFKASGEELPRNNSDDTVADNVEAPTKVTNKHVLSLTLQSK